jgi:hypothetical protein
MLGSDHSPPKPKRSGGNQPKHHAPKTRAASALRRKKIIKAIIEGKDHVTAGIDSGLSPKTASSQVSGILREPKTQAVLASALETEGITDGYLSQKLRTLIEGTKVISATVIAPGSDADLQDAGSMSKDFIEVPDNVAKAKGIEIACKIKGVFSEKREHEIKPGLIVEVKKFCSRGPKPAEGEKS